MSNDYGYLSTATSIDALADEIGALAANLDAATHRLLTCIREFDEREGWGKQGAKSCADWLCWRIGLDRGAAREKVRVARALGELPHIDDALRRGVISYSKVRAMTRVATPHNEEKLLELAIHATGADLERICRGVRSVLTAREAEDGLGRPVVEPLEARAVRVRSVGAGLVRIEAVLSADEAALVLRALQFATHGLRGERLAAETGLGGEGAGGGGSGGADGVDGEARGVSAETSRALTDAAADTRPTYADGLVAVAESYLAHGDASGTGGDRTQIVVHLEQDLLGPDGQLAACLDDGRGVSAETFRRLACDASLVPVLVDERGQVLDVGRRTRSIPPAIRRALRVRDRGCAFPSCTNTEYLHAHHIEHWLHGGETSVDNLVQLCSPHHRLVHEDGWAVERDAEGEIHFRAPEGTDVPRVWRPPAVDDATLVRWTGGLGITPRTNECKKSWGGWDLGWAVGTVVDAREPAS
ncbi:MAG: DUF222 domain-containing protein [Micrococcales bacterium]|nr:DUF222 domain-containing protein [Micrococcales bacterium]